MKTTIQYKLSFFALTVVGCTLSSCGGQTPGNLGSGLGNIGSVSFNIVGAAQSPVNRTSGTVAISGIAGATFTDIIYTDSVIQPVVFTSDEDGQATMMGMTQTSGQRTYLMDTLFTNPMADPFPFPDGKSYAFSTHTGTRWQLTRGNYGVDFSYNSLGNATTSNDEHPCVAPNGQQVYYTSDSDGNMEIWRLEIETSSRTQMTSTAPGISNQNPAISSDGEWLAYQSNRDGNNEIYVMNLTDLIERRITNNAGDDVEPAFNPNDLHLVFSSNRAGNYNLYRVLLRTGALLTQLTTDTGADREPTYSPDGSKIFYTSDRDDQAAPISTEIYSMLANGTSHTRISVDSSYNQKSPVVIPLLSPHLVGLGFNPSGSGLIVSQNASSVVSILGFEINSGSDANRGLTRVVSETIPGTTVPLIYYTITTPTSLSRVTYTKPSLKLFPTVVEVIPANPATDALITYSASGLNAGQVTSVFFYGANRSPLRKSMEGQNVVFEGSFTEAFDADGKKIGSGEISKVKIDPNGNLVSWQ